VTSALRRILPRVWAAGLATPLVGSALWLSSLAFRGLAALIAVVFALGLGAASSGYWRGSPAVRRVCVVAIGLNALGLALLGALYFAG
jgi:hypothetical protein